MKGEIKLSSGRQRSAVERTNGITEAKVEVRSALPLSSHESVHKLLNHKVGIAGLPSGGN